MEEGEEGIQHLKPWLLNIQVRKEVWRRGRGVEEGEGVEKGEGCEGGGRGVEEVGGVWRRWEGCGGGGRGVEEVGGVWRRGRGVEVVGGV